MTTRVTQACQRCQRRKLRCSGQPQCSACSARGQACVYGSASRRRGLAEGYVRGLERLLGFAMTRDATLDVDIRKLVSLEEPLQLEDTSITHGTMHEAWKKSIISSDIDHLLPALERGEASHWQSVFANGGRPIFSTHGSPSTSNFQEPRSVIMHDGESDVISGPGVDVQEVDVFYPERLDPEITLPSAAANEEVTASYATTEASAPLGFKQSHSHITVALPENSKQMIDDFLAYTNCWFPILERHELLRTFHQCRDLESVSSPCHIDDGHFAVLWAVLAFESCKKPENRMHDSQSLSRYPAYRSARSLIPTEEEEEEKYDLAHVQAVLILALINLGHGLWRSSYLLNGYALRLLQCCEGIQDSDNARTRSSSQMHSGRQRHISAGCFVLEKLLAIQLGLTMPLMSLDRPLTVPEDGLEEWETPVFQSSSVGSSTDNPAKILSTFNDLTSEADTIFRLFNGSEDDHASSSRQDLQQLLSVQKTLMSKSYERYISCGYSQYFTNYSVTLWALLVRAKQQIAAHESHTGNISGENIINLELLTMLSFAVQQFTDTHGPSRVPVLLVIILSGVLYELKAVSIFLPPREKPIAAARLQTLGHSLRDFGRHWPGFNHALQMVLPSMEVNSTPEHLGLVNMELGMPPEAGSKARDLSCHVPPLVPDLQQRDSTMEQHHPATGNISYDTIASCGPPIFDLNGTGLEEAEEIPIGITNMPQNSTANSHNVDDVYYQLAEADLIHWSGDWQEAGLRELGFDKNAFEQLYNRQ